MLARAKIRAAAKGGGISSPIIGRPEKPGPSYHASTAGIFWNPIFWKMLRILMAGNSDMVATLVGPDNKTTRMCWGPHTVATLAAHLLDLGFSPTQEVIIHQMGQRREATLGGLVSP
jgi:hypothetical protein